MHCENNISITRPGTPGADSRHTDTEKESKVVCGLNVLVELSLNGLRGGGGLSGLGGLGGWCGLGDQDGLSGLGGFCGLGGLS